MRITLLELVAVLAMGVSTVQLQTPENATPVIGAHRVVASTPQPDARNLEASRAGPVLKAAPPILATN
jgi:hypothetical protein